MVSVTLQIRKWKSRVAGTPGRASPSAPVTSSPSPFHTPKIDAFSLYCLRSFSTSPATCVPFGSEGSTHTFGAACFMPSAHDAPSDEVVVVMPPPPELQPAATATNAAQRHPAATFTSMTRPYFFVRGATRPCDVRSALHAGVERLRGR